MKKAKVLKEQRGTIKSNMRAMIAKAKEEKRELTQEEADQFDNWKAEAEALDPKIERAEAIEKEERELAFEAAQQRGDVRHFTRREAGEKGEKAKIQKRYSITRAMNLAATGKPLDGIEAEMHQQAEAEARAIGQSITGVGVPRIMFEKRTTLTAGTAATAGNLIATDLSNELIGALRPRLQVEQLGARMMTGLTGNMDIARQNGISSAEWEGETDLAAKTNLTTDKISLTPHRLGAFTEYGKQLLAQSDFSVEQIVREDLEYAIRKAVDYAAINGSGTGNIPEGILNTTGIGSVGGASAAAPTRDFAIEMETLIASADADVANMSYLTTPGVRGFLKNLKTDAGSGMFVMNNDNVLNGYPVAISTNVPNDLTDGTETDLHAIIFGNWRDLIIANWAGLDLVVDPYTKAKNATIVVTVNSWWDLAVRHPESFAAMKVADIS